jgi:hypothetical protein
MKDGIVTCRFCGRKIGIITWGIYRKVVVDAEAVPVVADPNGEAFVRIDGSKVRAREIGHEEEANLIRGTSKNVVEYVYREHRRNCSSGGSQ